MRRIVFALVLVLVCASAATGVRVVHASTQCERWIAEYRNALAHSPTIKRAKAVGHRLHRYVHRKIAALTKPKPAPKPHVLPVRHHRSKMTREEMLRRFELACGDLPEDSTSLGNLASDPPPTFIADRKPGDDALDLDSGEGPGMLLAMNQPPNYSNGGVEIPIWSGPGIYVPGFGGGWPLGGPHGNTPTTTPVTGTGGDNPPPPPPTAEAPEPTSLLLMATGFVGVAGQFRRRMQRAA